MEIRNLDCCGVKELSGISGGSPLTTLRSVCRGGVYPAGTGTGFHPPGAAFYLFTGIVNGDNDAYGGRLAAYITSHHLGRVHASDAATNPNSGNRIKVWIWEVDRPALQAWFFNTKRKAAVAKKKVVSR